MLLVVATATIDGEAAADIVRTAGVQPIGRGDMKRVLAAAGR